MYFVGIDLGQSKDFTAVCVLEKVTPEWQQGFVGWSFESRRAHRERSKPLYHVRHIDRLPLGTSYPAVVEYVKALLEKEPLKGSSVQIIADATGCGRPVIDMLRKELPRYRVIGVSIHGGDSTTEEGWDFRTPKRDLVATLQVLFQDGRLQIANALPSADLLMRELLNFRQKIDPITAHDSYSAWRENAHDDLVLSVALAAWYAERYRELEIW